MHCNYYIHFKIYVIILLNNILNIYLTFVNDTCVAVYCAIFNIITICTKLDLHLTTSCKAEIE